MMHHRACRRMTVVLACFCLLLAAATAQGQAPTTQNGLPATLGSYWVHVVSTDPGGNYSIPLDHPAANGHPEARLFVTVNSSAGAVGYGACVNDHPIAVEYFSDRWWVVNQDKGWIYRGAGFNVLLPPAGDNVFVHTTAPANSLAHRTILDHPLLNGRPGAIVFVTQNWGAGEPVADEHPVGVWYNGAQWEIFNEDLAPMPIGASFNVLVLTGHPAAYVHTATPSNSTNNRTMLDRHGVATNRIAFLLVTQVFNPAGQPGTYNNHNVGAYFDPFALNWSVSNEGPGWNSASMPAGASFNVLALGSQTRLPLVLGPDRH